MYSSSPDQYSSGGSSSWIPSSESSGPSSSAVAEGAASGIRSARIEGSGTGSAAPSAAFEYGPAYRVLPEVCHPRQRPVLPLALLFLLLVHDDLPAEELALYLGAEVVRYLSEERALREGLYAARGQQRVLLEGELHTVALVRLREASDVLQIERVAVQRVARVVERAMWEERRSVSIQLFSRKAIDKQPLPCHCRS